MVWALLMTDVDLDPSLADRWRLREGQATADWSVFHGGLPARVFTP